MLDKLPTELLLLVFHFAAPLDYSPSFYRHRRRLLRICCLVSKKLCGVAQPMLPQVYKVEKEPHVAVIVDEGDSKKRGKAVKLLVLQGGDEDEEPSWGGENICHLLLVCAEVVELRCLGMGTFELGWCRNMTGLQTLVIMGGNVVVDPADVPVFPSLVELSFCALHLPARSLGVFLTKATTPRLRALGTGFLTSLDGVVPVDILAGDILDQLDIVNIDAADCYNSLHHPERAPPSALVLDVALMSYRNSKGPLASCTRLYSPDDSLGAADLVLPALRTFRDQLEANPPLANSNFTVILPLHMVAEVEASGELRALLTMVASHGGEVIRERATDYNRESLISPAIWKRARRIKREKEEAERAKQV